MLHQQERKLAKKQRGWRDYYLATQSDTGVASFWRWLDTFAGVFRLLLTLLSFIVACNVSCPQGTAMLLPGAENDLSSPFASNFLIQTAWALHALCLLWILKVGDVSVEARNIEGRFLICRW